MREKKLDTYVQILIQKENTEFSKYLTRNLFLLCSVKMQTQNELVVKEKRKHIFRFKRSFFLTQEKTHAVLATQCQLPAPQQCRLLMLQWRQKKKMMWRI